MATVTLSSSSWDKGQIRVTYTASNGTLKITEIEGKRGDGYRSYNENDTAISISVGGTSKSISLSHYVDFGASGWVTWGATDTSWTGLTGTSVKISTKMQSGTPAYSGYTFSGNATMSWSKYTITYNANGGSGAPNAQTKTHGTNLTISSTKPTRTGYTFKGWALTKADADDGDWYYSSGSTCGKNEDLTLYAVWEENKLTVNYYSNYATSSSDGVTNAVGAGKNVIVKIVNYAYSTEYSSGLWNYTSTTSSFYLSRDGYTGTGKWGTSKSGGTLVDEDAVFGTGQALAKLLGKDLSSGNASVNIYAQWSENKLTVNYYSNYATYATYQGEAINVSANTNVLVYSQEFLYDNSYSSGLANIQNADYLYMKRTGYAPTGYWGTSVDGGTLVNQNASFSTGQELAQIYGKSLKNGNASVNIYAQWQENAYTLSYDSNGGFGEMTPQTIEWGELFQLPNVTFTRAGYEFVGWNAYRNEDNTWYVIGQGWVTEDEILANEYTKKLYENQCELTFDNSWVRDNEEARLYTMYAVWKISGVVYIHNDIKDEPYLVCIDNGESFDAYIAYIDNGTSWDIIS